MQSGAVFGQAVGLYQAGRLGEAEGLFRQVLAAQPGHVEALHYLGVCAYRRGDLEGAGAYLQAALAQVPGSPHLRNTLGLVLMRGQRLEEALASFQAAVAVAPDAPGFLNNLGLALVQLRRRSEALAAFGQALTLRRDFAEALSNLGKVLTDLGRPEEARDALQQAIALKPGFAEAHSNLAAAWREMGCFDAALRSIGTAITLNPHFPYARGYWLSDMLHGCIWDEYPQACSAIAHLIDVEGKAVDPFAILSVPSSAEQQLRCTRTYAREKYPASLDPLWQGERYSHARIRIGYFSADYHNHATAHLLAGLIERHDRTRFEIVGFSFGPARQDAWRRRMAVAFDRFVDMPTASDRQIAAAAREQEIDIAVDLKGFTRDARPGIFAHRPAPLQVNYLGYPGSMGAEYFDYILADRVVIPATQLSAYSERVVWLPHSYQANDSTKAIASLDLRRADHGLPEAGFVFCCFNNNYKITPDVFDIWMRLLGAVDGSVLWLFEANPVAAANLRKEAGKRGVAPERLVFAPRLELADHLARHRLADLFLDTFHYNAHTTASDALWAGLPVLTCLGATFAGRVAASLLHALNLPELVTESPARYEAMALQLATSSASLQAIRAKLLVQRETAPLFDTAGFTRDMEAAYLRMWQRQQDGLPAAHFDVAEASSD